MLTNYLIFITFPERHVKHEQHVYNNKIDDASWPVGEGSLAVEGDQPAGMRED